MATDYSDSNNFFEAILLKAIILGIAILLSTTIRNGNRQDLKGSNVKCASFKYGAGLN